MNINNKYPYSFANYPTGFRGCVISPTKICIQYADPQIKLRLHGATGEELNTVPGTKNRYVPVIKDGIEILTLAVGCQLPVLEEVQFGLIDAYRTYYLVHKDTYKKTYNKNFIEFLRKLKEQVDYINLLAEQEEVKLNGST